MKLNLVERRTVVAAPDPWDGGAAIWPRLSALAGELGASGWCLDVVLIDDRAMTELNGQWRGADEVTDVLSFSYLEEEGWGVPTLATGEGAAARDLWVPAEVMASQEASVGEVVLAPAFVLDRCRERGWDPDLEWPLLVVHGMLHILGWQHDTDAELVAMQDTEAAILGRADWEHPLRGRS